MSYAPRRWSSYRSLTEQDEVSSGMKEISPDSLVDICIGNVLQSYYLIGEAGKTLPNLQAHYILYLALKRLVNGEPKSYMMLHKLITCWTHKELKFDFQSNFLVQKYIRASSSTWRSCLIPPYVHYGIKGITKTRFELCTKDIAIGLFNNAYHSLSEDNGSRMSKLDTIDISEVQLATEPHPIWGTDITAESLYALSRGEFPGRAAYECLSPEDILYLGIKKPTLHNLTKTRHITLKVNFNLSSLKHIEDFIKTTKTDSHFRLQLKVLDISSLDDKGLATSMEKVDLSNLQTMIVSGSQTLTASVLSRPSCLWCLQEKTTGTDLLKQLLMSSKVLKQLLVSVTSLTCSPVLEVIASSQNIILNCFSVFGGGGSPSNYPSLGNCLSRVGSQLEYLHLINWIPTCIPNDKLALCENLRVLSIIGKESFPLFEQSIGSIFKILSTFEKLEYLELYQNLALKAPDLVQLKNLLKHTTTLAHCHINFSGLTLKRADLDVQTNSPVHSLIRLCLGSGTRGNSLLYRQAEHFSFKLIKGWLKDLRPDICFELDYRDSSMFNDLVHLKGRRHFL